MENTIVAEVLTPSIWEAFRVWINQRPGLDPRNYYNDWRDSNGRKAYQSEARSIQKDGQRARKALTLAQMYPFDGASLLEACRSGFSGRLSIGEDGTIDYCTGQYWPTEYRIAAAVVLERYAEAVRPKQTPGGRIPRSIAELKDMNRAAGGHFFDRDTMRCFRSRALPSLFVGPGGIYFVTSEAHGSEPRRFTVRRFDPQEADVDTFGDFGGLSRNGALSQAKMAAALPKPPCHICGGTGRKYTTECWHCKGTANEPSR